MNGIVFYLIPFLSFVWWITLIFTGKQKKQLSWHEILQDFLIILFALLEDNFSIIESNAYSLSLAAHSFLGVWILLFFIVLPFLSIFAYRYYELYSKDLLLKVIENLSWKIFIVLLFLPLFIIPSFFSGMKSVEEGMNISSGNIAIIMSAIFFFVPFVIYISVHKFLLQKFPMFLKEVLPAFSVLFVNVIIFSLLFVYLDHYKTIPKSFSSVLGLYLFYRVTIIFSPPFSLSSITLGIVNAAYFFVFLKRDFELSYQQLSDALSSAVYFVAAFIFVFGIILYSVLKNNNFSDKNNPIIKENKKVISYTFAICVLLIIILKSINNFPVL